MSVLKRNFLANDIVAVTGVPLKNIQNWTDRGFITGQSAGVRGKPRIFSWYSLIEVAVANELMHGFMAAPADAFKVAKKVSHTGVENSALTGASRNPGLPYHHNQGDTFIVVKRSSAQVILATQIPSAIESSDKVALVINFSAIFNDICGALRLHPYVVLDAEYPEDVS